MMPNDDKQGLIEMPRLSGAEIAEIEQLAQICDTHDRASVRVNWEMLAARSGDRIDDFLHYQDGRLVGALALYSFNRSEAETSGMVHPDYRRRGIFRALVRAAIEELKRRDTPKLIFFCDHSSRSGIATLEALGAQYGYSEHKMALDQARIPESFDERLRVEQAGEAGAADVAHIIALCFGGSAENMRGDIVKNIGSDTRRYYLARLEGTPIGALNMVISGHEAGIYGFGVLPEYRGRGYGRQILARAIEYAQADGPRRVILEVAPENERALGLYLSVGFRETNRYDYYILDVPQGTAASRTAQ
jgi:ribosomal protein S18 acetylase RimI-like enzyme